MNTAQRMKFSIKHFFSECDQIRSFLRIWSHLLKKLLMENFVFCAVETCLRCTDQLKQITKAWEKMLKPIKSTFWKKLFRRFETLNLTFFMQNSLKPVIHYHFSSFFIENFLKTFKKWSCKKFFFLKKNVI